MMNRFHLIGVNRCIMEAQLDMNPLTKAEETIS